jgi:tripartite-type tricarboxylate transporter receptor subunit TctC
MKKTFPGAAGGRWQRRGRGIPPARSPARTRRATWPGTQPIKLVVPFTAGSGTDIVARLVAEKLGPALGTSVIVDNKPGAGGTLGAALTAKAPADGYTLLVHSAGHLVNPWIYKGLSYDTLKDFTGITPMASLPNVLVTAPSHFADVKDLVAKAKAKPGGLNYGSAGNGSATHMNAEVFRLAAGLDAQHVPFRGTPEAMTEVMAGRVDWFFAPMVSALPLIQSGKLQALAVGTGKRSSALPKCADDGRGRRAGLGVPVLGRPVRAREDAAAGGRAPAGRGREDHGVARAEGAAREARRRALHDAVGAVQQVHRRRDGQGAAGGEGRQHQGRLTWPARSSPWAALAASLPAARCRAGATGRPRRHQREDRHARRRRCHRAGAGRARRPHRGRRQRRADARALGPR